MIAPQEHLSAQTLLNQPANKMRWAAFSMHAMQWHHWMTSQPSGVACPTAPGRHSFSSPPVAIECPVINPPSSPSSHFHNQCQVRRILTMWYSLAFYQKSYLIRSFKKVRRVFWTLIWSGEPGAALSPDCCVSAEWATCRATWPTPKVETSPGSSSSRLAGPRKR